MSPPPTSPPLERAEGVAPARPGVGGRRTGLRRVASGVGRVLVAGGVLLLLFVAYLLWGTGLQESSHQQALRRTFDRELAVAGRQRVDPAPSATPGRDVPTLSSTAAGASPAEGRPVAILAIPRIGLDSVVVQGTDTDDLRLGPGHYVGTPMPGQAGNAAIAGHRTTYGAPFADLGELRPGDDVWATTTQGRFRYLVVRSLVVSPADTAVLDPSSAAELTLTTCTPPYSAAQRLVVQARLAGAPLPDGTVHRAAAVGLAGEVGDPVGAVTWGVVCGGLVLAVWMAGRGRRHRWAVHLAGGVAVLAALFMCFESLSPLLPASF